MKEKISGFAAGIKDVAAKVKTAISSRCRKAAGFLKKHMTTQAKKSAVALCSLYMMRAIVVLALVMAVAEGDGFDIILCSIITGIMLLPMEDVFAKTLS